MVQGINNTTIYAEKIYKTKFSEQSKKIVLSLHYNGDNSYLFVKGSQELKFKSSVNYLDRNLLCVGNISSAWSLANSTKTGLYRNFYEFAVGYVGINGVKTIYDIHRYLMKKHNIIYKMFRLLEKVIILIILIQSAFGYCLLLNNQECKVRKAIIDNDYMTFPFKIKVDKCIGSCNDRDNPDFKVCLPDSIKNVSLKSFDLISKKNVLKNISFHQNCKCGCLLDEKVCNNLQKGNKDKCRSERLKLKIVTLVIHVMLIIVDVT